VNAPQMESQAASQDGLWQEAPAWRNLVVAASLLTMAALAMPLLITEETPPGAPPPPLETVTATPAIILPAMPPPVHKTRLAAAPQARPTQAEPAAPVCNIAMGRFAVMSGTVIGFINHDQSLRIFANTGRNNGGTVSPAWVDNVRVRIQPDPGTFGGSRNPLVPAGMTVAIGDHVTYVTPSLDTSRPCGFIPSHIMARQEAVPAAEVRP
jgi:hypothetical protein